MCVPLNITAVRKLLTSNSRVEFSTSDAGLFSILSFFVYMFFFSRILRILLALFLFLFLSLSLSSKVDFALQFTYIPAM